MRIFRQSTKDEIVASNVRRRSGWCLGKVESLSCSLEVLRLFAELESYANENMLGMAEEVQEKINELEFLVDVGEGASVRCENLQIMNGVDVAFVIANPSGDEGS